MITNIMLYETDRFTEHMENRKAKKPIAHSYATYGVGTIKGYKINNTTSALVSWKNYLNVKDLDNFGSNININRKKYLFLFRESTKNYEIRIIKTIINKAINGHKFEFNIEF